MTINNDDEESLQEFENGPDLLNNSEKDRFWNKVEIGCPDECWEWQAAKDRDGYGIFKLRGKKLRAHQVAVMMDGREPSGQVVRHTCDNPGCCNPHHLEVGTQTENMRDKVERGRHNRGVKNGSSKLSAEKVRLIRASDRPSRELAEEHGVSPGTIRTVRTGRTWIHVE